MRSIPSNDDFACDASSSTFSASQFPENDVKLFVSDTVAFFFLGDALDEFESEVLFDFNDLAGDGFVDFTAGGLRTFFVGDFFEGDHGETFNGETF